jgi:phytoene synthase
VTDGAADDTSYVTALVRSDDRPRYYATLFAPGEIRADLFALYGFAAEIARVPDLVREPTLGEIRLKWWSDALTETVVETAPGETPSLRAVSQAIVRQALPIAPALALIEARAGDLYSDPPGSLTDLEGYLGETESVLFQMAALMAGGGSETADAAGHAGVAYGLTRRLARFGSDRARMRTVLPATLLAEKGLAATDVFSETPSKAVWSAVTALARHTQSRLRQAQEAIAALPRGQPTAFLPMAVVPPLLQRIERAGAELASRDAGISDIETLTRIALARLR